MTSNGGPDPKRLNALAARAKRLAKDYYRLTQRPLGVTGEIAELEAARILGLEIAPVRHPGYDATGRTPGSRKQARFQIKGRCVREKYNPGARIGRIDLAKDWDAVLLVLLDDGFDATAIYRVERAAVETALRAPGSKARNERGALGIGKFKSIARQVWNRSTDA